MNQADFDSPWKDVLDLFFEAALEFFFPAAHVQIDWARGYEFLDKELQKITADAALGRRVADKLVKVWLKTGQELWVLLHLEVQGQRETDFATRVYVYNFRIFDRFNAPVASFVILTDDERNWRPAEYRAGLLGTKLQFEFPIAKLLDYGDRWDELEQSDGPFAVIVQAHLTALRTRDNSQERLQSKWHLTRRLYERGFNKREIIGLFRFLDWVLTLPDDLAGEYEGKLTQYEEEQKMKYVTSIERHGMQKGFEKGLKSGVVDTAVRLLQRRFGALDEATQSHINALPLEQAQELTVAVLDFSAPAELTAWLQLHAAPANERVN